MAQFLSPYFLTERFKDSTNFSGALSGFTIWTAKQFLKGWEHYCVTEYFWVIIDTQPVNIQISGIASSEAGLLLG